MENFFQDFIAKNTTSILPLWIFHNTPTYNGRKYPSVFLPSTIFAPGKVDKTHVWSFMTKYLRFLCKFTSWSGETPTGNFNHAFFFFILNKNNERTDWMNDLKHTDAC